MAINLDFDTQQKLLRVSGMINTSVNALSNLLLREACRVLDSESIQKMLKDSAVMATHTIVGVLLEGKKVKAKKRY